MARNEDLERRILENLDDPSAFLVYGDWLTEQGDPRGELVMVQANREKNFHDDKLRVREAQIIAANPEWIGDLASVEEISLGWRLGFLDKVRFGPDTEQYESGNESHERAYAILMKLPGISFIREIVLGSFNDEDEYMPHWDGCIDAIADHGAPPKLRKLSINRGGFWDISSTYVTNLERAYSNLRELRELYIEVGNMDFGAIDLPKLESLEVVTGGLVEGNLESIRKANWPHLRSLLLCLGDANSHYGCDVTIDSVKAFVSQLKAPELRHFGLANSNLVDAIVPLVANAPFVKQLETLDLSRGTMTDEGAETLRHNASALRHLERIDCRRNFLSPEAANRLRETLPNALVTDQEQGHEYDGKTYRYCSIGE